MEAIRCLSELKWLSIYKCPELCASGSGSEWDCISHISDIRIDDRWIQQDGDPTETRIWLHQDDDNEQLPVRATGLRHFICCRN
ncbi:hypothetical protein SLEP1_g42727 [Rubroshorea leprosula]|uniref:Uncharacterized protein n=1 Tax=Rubroshorea leprosula TaxID=152421 RepID=A0AAV5LAS5_9ROSI|nr:hypothetical protein SLEP1_g42727 [Rubroshorea leprosula]